MDAPPQLNLLVAGSSMLPVALRSALPRAPQEILSGCVCTSEKVLIQTLKLVLQMIKLKLLLQLLLLSSHTRRRDHCFLLEKAWCLVGVCVVPTPAFSIKTSRKRDHLKVKIRNPFTALFIVSLDSYYYMYTNPCHPEFVTPVREQKSDAQVHLL